MGPDPVTGVLRRRRDGDTRESHVKTQGKDGPPKQGRETSLADANQTSSLQDTGKDGPPKQGRETTSRRLIRRPASRTQGKTAPPSRGEKPASRTLIRRPLGSTASHAAGSAALRPFLPVSRGPQSRGQTALPPPGSASSLTWDPPSPAESPGGLCTARQH